VICSYLQFSALHLLTQSPLGEAEQWTALALEGLSSLAILSKEENCVGFCKIYMPSLEQILGLKTYQMSANGGNKKVCSIVCVE
jgi:hypothetical protein